MTNMTNSSATNAEILLSQALAGSQGCFGRLLHLYRNYLKLLVMSHLERKLQARVSPSDIVQETYLEASRDFDKFRGSTNREFRAWLRQILVNNLHRVVEQHVLTQKRDVRREISLEALARSLDQSTARLERFLPAPDMSPSNNIQQFEMEIKLADKLADLPADYREVIVLRHIEALPFECVGRRMERSAGAARMLWLRAIQSLRESMQS
jgi:RNA polymerase sigma-70 factor (ECF subfamily)